MSETIRRVCIVCNKEIHSALRGEVEDRFENPPSNATFWTTYGNYGSTVFDDRYYKLEMYLCDPCLVERSDRVYRVREHIEQKLTTEFKPFSEFMSEEEV